MPNVSSLICAVIRSYRCVLIISTASSTPLLSIRNTTKLYIEYNIGEVLNSASLFNMLESTWLFKKFNLASGFNVLKVVTIISNNFASAHSAKRVIFDSIARSIITLKFFPIPPPTNTKPPLLFLDFLERIFF